MITLERSTDYLLLREIATHPKIYSKLTDDFAPVREEWKPAEDDRLIYLLVRENQKPVGWWMAVPVSRIMMDVHTVILPEFWGSQASAAAKLAIQWVWENTECLRLTTVVPCYNRIALRFAKEAGMREYGVNPLSIMKHGKLHDQILLGISKCQQPSPSQQS